MLDAVSVYSLYRPILEFRNRIGKDVKGKGTSAGDPPGRVLLVLRLHHVPQAGVGQRLGEVRVGRHEAVVVEARPQVGGAQPEGLPLGAAGPAQRPVVLGGQVGAEQSLQQLVDTTQGEVYEPRDWVGLRCTTSQC